LGKTYGECSRTSLLGVQPASKQSSLDSQEASFGLLPNIQASDMIIGDSKIMYPIFVV
jgi:hypothetical protein